MGVFLESEAVLFVVELVHCFGSGVDAVEWI